MSPNFDFHNQATPNFEKRPKHHACTRDTILTYLPTSIYNLA